MTDENRANENKVRLRAAVSDGYAMVKSQALAESLAQATPEQLMVEQLDDLVGPGPNPRRQSRLERIRASRAQIQDAIRQIRSMTPEELAMSSASDSEDSALTEEEPDGAA